MLTRETTIVPPFTKKEIVPPISEVHNDANNNKNNYNAIDKLKEHQKH